MSVQILDKIEKRTGLNPWKIFRALGKKHYQSYLSMKEAKKISFADLVKLQELYKEHAGGDLYDFWDLVKAEASGTLQRKRKGDA